MLHQRKFARKRRPIHDRVQQTHTPVFANQLILFDQSSVGLQSIASRHLSHHKQGTLPQQETEQAVEERVALFLHVIEIHRIYWALWMLPELLNVLSKLGIHRRNVLLEGPAPLLPCCNLPFTGAMIKGRWLRKQFPPWFSILCSRSVGCWRCSLSCSCCCPCSCYHTICQCQPIHSCHWWSSSWSCWTSICCSLHGKFPLNVTCKSLNDQCRKRKAMSWPEISRFATAHLDLPAENVSHASSRKTIWRRDTCIEPTVPSFCPTSSILQSVYEVTKSSCPQVQIAGVHKSVQAKPVFISATMQRLNGNALTFLCQRGLTQVKLLTLYSCQCELNCMTLKALLHLVLSVSSLPWVQWAIVCIFGFCYFVVYASHSSWQLEPADAVAL